jgi:hypothetical protein
MMVEAPRMAKAPPRPAVSSKNGGRGNRDPASRNRESGITLGNLDDSTEDSEMKQVIALLLGLALVGGSAATTFAQTGTGGGTGGGTGTKSTTTTTSPTGTKSTTTTTSPTTRQTTSQTTSSTTAPTTSKNKDCPGLPAGKHGRHKGLEAHNPNC